MIKHINGMYYMDNDDNVDDGNNSTSIEHSFFRADCAKNKIKLCRYDRLK